MNTKAIPIKTKQGETIDLLDICQSVGGSIYGTTPGGTRRVYRRDMLLSLRATPETFQKPFNLPVIPGVTKQKAEDTVPQVTTTQNNEDDIDDEEFERRAVDAQVNGSGIMDDEDEDDKNIDGGDDELFDME